MTRVYKAPAATCPYTCPSQSPTHHPHTNPLNCNAVSPPQDLLKLRALFHADGDGLDRDAIDGELERVRRLLPLMGTEVGPLLDMVKQVRRGMVCIKRMKVVYVLG